MIQNIEKYLDALFSAHASVSSLEEALNTVKSNAELKEIFNDPNVTLEEKKTFVRSFLPRQLMILWQSLQQAERLTA